MDDLKFCNGLNAAEGGYLALEIPEADIASFFRDRFSGEIGQAEIDRLNQLHARNSQAEYPVIDEVDERDLSQTGWAAIFPEGLDPAVREALQPLLEHRREVAASRWPQGYRELTGPSAYRRGESATRFLQQFGVGLGGPVDPRQMPYLLLLVGGPELVPFEVQHELGAAYAVGRLDLPSPEAYARYAESVVAVEKGAARPRKAVFFGPANPDDPATEVSSRLFVGKLAQELATRPGIDGWELSTVVGPLATKARLTRELGGPDRPALLLAAGHGTAYPYGTPHQREDQGAFVCQDWPGRLAAPLIDRQHFFTAEDLPPEADLSGQMVFLFNCFGLGTPDRDDFYSLTPRPFRAADTPFTARLPQRLLEHGALAVLGHVDRAWTASFLSSASTANEDLRLFTDCLRRLMVGKPAGYAREPFGLRWTGLSGVIHNRLQAQRRGEPVDVEEFARLGLPATDARNYVLLGDPGVRLATGDAAAAPS
jgi:hypothetical protein